MYEQTNHAVEKWVKEELGDDLEGRNMPWLDWCCLSCLCCYFQQMAVLEYLRVYPLN